MIKAVIFDFDGTLIDNLNLHLKSFQMALGSRMKIEARDLFIREGGYATDIIRDMTRNLNLDSYEFDRLTKEKIRIYEEISGGLRMRPEAIVLLNELRKLGYKTGLATGSARHVLKQHMDASDEALFDFMVTGDQTGRHKPHPEPYLLCAEGLGVKPEECVVVENAPLGIESAKSAGMVCIALTSTMERDDLRRADFVIDRLEEAGIIISRLSGKAGSAPSPHAQ